MKIWEVLEITYNQLGLQKLKVSKSFSSYRVLVYDEETKQHVEKIFQYPSFCICKLGEVKKKGFKYMH